MRQSGERLIGLSGFDNSTVLILTPVHISKIHRGLRPAADTGGAIECTDAALSVHVSVLAWSHVPYWHAGRISQHSDSRQQQESSCLVENRWSRARSSCSLNHASLEIIVIVNAGFTRQTLVTGHQHYTASRPAFSPGLSAMLFH